MKWAGVELKELSLEDALIKLRELTTPEYREREALRDMKYHQALDHLARANQLHLLKRASIVISDDDLPRPTAVSQ
jgi:hypothetical protein